MIKATLTWERGIFLGMSHSILAFSRSHRDKIKPSLVREWSKDVDFSLKIETQAPIGIIRPSSRERCVGNWLWQCLKRSSCWLNARISPLMKSTQGFTSENQGCRCQQDFHCLQNVSRIWNKNYGKILPAFFLSLFSLENAVLCFAKLKKLGLRKSFHDSLLREYKRNIVECCWKLSIISFHFVNICKNLTSIFIVLMPKDMHAFSSSALIKLSTS